MPTTEISQYVRGLIDGRPFGGIVSVAEFGARTDVDSTAAFQAAINSGARKVLVPAGHYIISAPLVLPNNTGIWLQGLGGAKAVRLYLSGDLGSDPSINTRAMIEYKHPAPGNQAPNFAGCIIENLHLDGRGFLAHGLFLQDVHYPILRNVLIEQFVGSALLIDKCQDGSFSNVAVIGSGRVVDATRTWAPLHLRSTVTFPDGSLDHNNMLRFHDLQIENNRVSPYVYFEDWGAIGIWFDKIHGEIAVTEAKDFAVLEGGDVHFSHVALSPTFRDGFILKGYGNVHFEHCRDVRSVRHQHSGVTGSITMIDVACGQGVEWTGLGGQNRFLDCQLGPVTISYPGQGPSTFTDCSMVSVSVDHAGAGNGSIRLFNCVLQTYTVDGFTVDQWLVNSIVTTTCTVQSPSARVENCQLPTGAATTITPNATHIPLRRQSWSASIPAGTAAVGDLAWNSGPNSGEYIGWVYTPVGWRGFGVIA